MGFVVVVVFFIGLGIGVNMMMFLVLYVVFFDKFVVDVFEEFVNFYLCCESIEEFGLSLIVDW